MLEVVITVLVTTTVLAEKCRNSVDQGVRWTVDCSGMNLSVAPPPVILHPVMTLNISHNVFAYLTDSQFVNWTDIFLLDISSNQITTIEIDAFRGLNDLTELNLKDNRITVLSINITSHLSKLRVLNLGLNNIKELSYESFKPIPLLLKLYLKSNIELGKARNNYNSLDLSFNQGLISLDLSNCSLSEIAEDFFHNASHLISLNIAENLITSIPYLPRTLRSLNISATSIDTVPQRLFSNSELLEKLYLQKMMFLRDIKARSFNGLTHLEELTIKDCPKLSFISEDTFGTSAPKFRRFVISNCSLTTLPKTFEPLLDRVEVLDLQGNPWFCDGRIIWLTKANILANLTGNLRCDQPAGAHGQRLHDYYQPKSLHHHFTLIQGAVVVLMVAVFVASVIGMLRHVTKQKVKTYRQLQDIALQERTPTSLPPL